MTGAVSYPEAEFGTPSPHGYVYAGFRVDPPRRAPFVRASKQRQAVVAELREFQQRLGNRASVVRSLLLEATFMPPIAGSPRCDLVSLVQTRNIESASEILKVFEEREPRPAIAFAATNAYRIGNTEQPLAGTFLLNHFTGADSSTAAEAWRGLTGWYTQELGVDNSTLLSPVAEAPFAIVNFVRLPRGALAFLFGQLRRPSFFSFVRNRLRSAHLHAMPIFYRLVDV